MSERERVLEWIGGMADAWALFEGGKHTKRMVDYHGSGLEITVNVSCGCTNGKRSGVTVRKFEGREVCEFYTWREVEKACNEAKGRKAYAKFVASAPEQGAA